MTPVENKTRFIQRECARIGASTPHPPALLMDKTRSEEKGFEKWVPKAKRYTSKWKDFESGTAYALTRGGSRSMGRDIGMGKPFLRGLVGYILMIHERMYIYNDTCLDLDHVCMYKICFEIQSFHRSQVQSFTVDFF